MKTTVIGSNKGKSNTPSVSNKTENQIEPQKINGLPVSREFNNDAKTKKAEINPTVSEQPKPQVEPNDVTQKPEVEQAKPEVTEGEALHIKEQSTKKEVKEEVKQKTVLNLESTLKLVEELHRRKIQRDRLLDTINTLEAFEIAQQEDAEETDSNHFQGCVLTIEDDERRKFSTKNPVIIQAVAQFVNRMCIDRLAEIEAGITISA